MEKALTDYNIKIAALQEVRRLGIGVHKMKNGWLYYSGKEEGKKEEGVGFYVADSLNSSVMQFDAISSRMAKLRLTGRWFNVTLICAYVPTDVSNDLMKDQWYALLEETMAKIPRHDMLVLLGDLNAKVGREVQAFSPAIGSHSLHEECNDNGVRLASMALQHGLVIGGTIFPHKAIHKGTWISPGGNVINQIDHVLVRHKHRTSLQDVRVYRRADCDSDHHLVVAKVLMKLSCERRNRVERTRKTDIEKLQNEDTRAEYQLELTNRFAALQDEASWDDVKHVVLSTAGDVLGHLDGRGRRNPWFDEDCENICEERKEKRIQWLEDQDNEVKRDEFRSCRRRAKRTIRRKKREELEAKLRRLEGSRREGKAREQYQIIKSFKNEYQPKINLVRDKEGAILAQEEGIKRRWAEYFECLLNREDPEHPVDDYEPVMDMMLEPSEEIIRRAILSLKNNKAAGTDTMQGELLKYGGNVLQERMITVVRNIWNMERIPEEWETAIYIPLHKKGDRASCANYRGLSLLNIGYKVLANVLYALLSPYYRDAIGDYQAGFLPGKSTIENIFIIRQICEKQREYGQEAWHVFVDYAQAYDSVHRDSLWNILRSFMVPEKLIRVLKACYHSTKGQVRVGGQLTDPFDIETGLKQGCPLSCALFNMALEWIMRRVPQEQDPIQFTNGVVVGRLGYADDVDFVGRQFVPRDGQMATFRTVSGRVGLEVKEAKTKAMRIS